jgi:hypothetical protein
VERGKVERIEPAGRRQAHHINVHPHAVHGAVTDLVVGSVDEDFVEDFVQAGSADDVLEHHALAIVHPELLLLALGAPNVGIWTEKDVL